MQEDGQDNLREFCVYEKLNSRPFSYSIEFHPFRSSYILIIKEISLHQLSKSLC